MNAATTPIELNLGHVSGADAAASERAEPSALTPMFPRGRTARTQIVPDRREDDVPVPLSVPIRFHVHPHARSSYGHQYTVQDYYSSQQYSPKLLVVQKKARAFFFHVCSIIPLLDDPACHPAYLLLLPHTMRSSRAEISSEKIELGECCTQ